MQPLKLSCVPILNRKIKFALVGCGRISRNHLQAFQEHASNIDFVAVCDNDAQALSQVVESTGAKGFSDLKSMLAACDADVVSICTPSGIHSQQTIEVAKSGRHVVTEKPMATRWHDGIEMVRACEEAKVQLFVVKQNRHNATLQLLKKAISSNRFGKINMVALNVFWTRPQDYYDQASWRGTWEMDGGALMNQASHYVDLLDWLVGPIESVHAYLATLGRKIEAEDTATLGIKWRSGALGSVNVTMLTYPKNFEGSITILGDRGSVRIGGVAVNQIQHWEFDEPGPEDNSIREASYETTSVYGFGHPIYYHNVIQTLRGEATPETDGHEGLKSLELLIAAYRSARQGARIGLPLEL